MKARLEDWLYIHWGLKLALPGYFLMLCISIALGCWLLLRYARRNNLNERAVYSFLCLAIPLLFLGAKLLYAVQFPRVFGKGWDFWLGAGASLYGGLLGVAAAAVVIFWYYRVSPWPVLDGLALSLGLGLGITRLGCFLGGCNWGAPTAGPWGVCFPRESPAFRQHVAQGLIGPDAWLSQPVHPTQLYEAGAGFLLFLLGAWWIRRRRFEGEVFIGLLGIYAIFRFFEEYIRRDFGARLYDLFSFSQIVSLALVMIASWAWALRTRGSERRVHPRVFPA